MTISQTQQNNQSGNRYRKGWKRASETDVKIGKACAYGTQTRIVEGTIIRITPSALWMAIPDRDVVYKFTLRSHDFYRSPDKHGHVLYIKDERLEQCGAK